MGLTLKQEYERGRRHAYAELLAHVKQCALGNMLFMFQFPKAPKWQYLSSKYGELTYDAMAQAIEVMRTRSHRRNGKFSAARNVQQKKQLAKIPTRKTSAPK